jgi:hypothetical protein
MDETAVDSAQNEAEFLLTAPLAMHSQAKVDSLVGE